MAAKARHPIESPFRALLVAFYHKALHTTQLNDEVLVKCETNGGWRGVFEFQGEILTVLCYFCSDLYTTRLQIDGKIRYVAIFFPYLKKDMSLMSMKCAFIWWYFCIGP